MNEWLVGSGRCATHNVKNVRQKYENGALRWSLSETTVLECPRAFSRQTTEYCSDLSELPDIVGTNGKTDIVSSDTNYQSDRRDNN